MGVPRGTCWLVGGATLGVLVSVAGWGVTDHLERNNDFCNACHIDDDQPLHAEIRRDFERSPPASLAALHSRASSDGDGEFRCIDCHGGASWPGRARVKALAAMDAFWYVVGHFEEPDGMRWPLWDEDCSQCHDGFDESEPLTWETPRFHQLPVHNVELGVACVECHRTHHEGDEDNHFLSVIWVRTQCARCHTEFEEGSG